MAEKRIELNERNAANTGWDTLLPATVASVVKMANGETVETVLSRKADSSQVSTKVNQESGLPGGTDLNTVMTSGFYRFLDGVINAPPSSVSAYSQMIVSRGADTFTQIVCSYSQGTMHIRSGIVSNPSGYPWRELVTLDGDTLRHPLVAQANSSYSIRQLRNTIISPSNPSGGASGDVWLKYK